MVRREKGGRARTKVVFASGRIENFPFIERYSESCDVQRVTFDHKQLECIEGLSSKTGNRLYKKVFLRYIEIIIYRLVTAY